MKTIVAYFSAGGTTANLARKFAETTGSDLFEIVPEQPYSAEDLDWTDPEARCNREFNAGEDVPVVGRIENLADYDLIFLGFPIWYERAPNIVRTFCQGYDWTGRNVALFATSGGSDIGDAAEQLRPFMPGANIVHAQVMQRDEGKKKTGEPAGGKKKRKKKKAPGRG